MSIAKAKAFWPLTITAGVNNGVGYIGGLAGGPFVVRLPAGTYYSAALLAAAWQVAVRAGTGFADFTVTVTATGFFKIARTLGTFDIYLNGLPALDLNGVAVVGWGTVDAATVLSYTGPNQHQNGWYADVATRSDGLPVRETDNNVVTLTMAGQTKKITETELISRELKWEFLKPEKTYIAYESTSINQSIERWWQDGGARFRYWSDGTVEATYDDYVLDQETSRQFKPKRSFDKKALYEVLFRFRKYVA